MVANEQATSVDPAPRRLGWLLLLIVSLAIMGGLFALRAWRADSIPPLSPDAFHAAWARWESAAPPDYNLEVVVRGSQPATYAVQVRNGQAENATRNGRPLNQRRTFGTWSVPGMFSTMQRDVEAIERRARPNADPNLPQLTLRAQFDSRYSYPARYRRIEWGSPTEVSWEVTRFELISPPRTDID